MTKKSKTEESTLESGLAERKTKDAAIEADKKLADDMEAYDKKLPKFDLMEDGTFQLTVSHVGTFSEMFGGSQSMDFVTAMAHSCANVSGQREAFEQDKKHALAIVVEIAPQDGVEAMLATQMAAVHIASIRQSRLLASSDTIQQLEANERAFNKLTRTFTAQMEALRKHRHGGKQTVTVQHVNVEDGGQAIVGNVSKGGGAQK